MGTQARSFDLNLYELGVCRKPAGARIEVAHEVTDGKTVTVEANSESWRFRAINGRARDLDPDAIRRDGQTVDIDELPRWLGVALDFVGCKLERAR